MQADEEIDESELSEEQKEWLEVQREEVRHEMEMYKGTSEEKAAAEPESLGDDDVSYSFPYRFVLFFEADLFLHDSSTLMLSLISA